MSISQGILGSAEDPMCTSLVQTAISCSSNFGNPYQNAHAYIVDIQTALLRTCYYWSRYIIYRPFVYKVLHFPEQVTKEDATGAAECLCSALKWPIAMVSAANNKQLIPNLFLWSQEFLGILILLYTSQQNNLLGQIRRSFLGERFEIGANETVKLYLDWLEELRPVDPAAKWCWDIASALYHLES